MEALLRIRSVPYRGSHMAMLDGEPDGFVDRVGAYRVQSSRLPSRALDGSQRLNAWALSAKSPAGPRVAIALRQRSVVPAGPQILKFS